MSDSIVRVQYYPKQFLRTADFTDEQAYHLAMRRRHNIAHHIWGIVYGLEINSEEKDQKFWVQPGIAIDGYGRELILQEKKQIEFKEFNLRDSDALDVWIVYNRQPTDATQRNTASCNNSEQSADRWREIPLIFLSIAVPGVQDRRQPMGVPAEVLRNFGPHHTPPDDLEQRWLVFLGQIQREQADPSKPFEYKVNPVDRPYAGLIGEAIVAPSGRASLQIGAQRADDPYRFALFVPDRLSQSGTTVPPPNPEPRLAIRQNGELDIRGQVKVYGDLKLADGAIVFGVGSARSSRMPSWRMYRQQETVSTDSDQGNANGKVTGITNGQTSSTTTTGQQSVDSILQHQLRIEMEQGGIPGQNQVVIGSWSADKKVFQPFLTITDDGNTTVTGNLIVTGKIVDASRSTAPPTPETANATQAAFLTGIAGASTLLQRLYRNPATGDLGIVGQLLDVEQGRESVASLLLETPERREPFLMIVLANEQGRSAVVKSLEKSEAPAKSAFLSLLVASNNVRGTIIQSLLSQHLLTLIAEVIDKDPIAVISALLTKDRAAVVTELLKDDPGRQAIVAGLAADGGVRKAFIALLLPNANARMDIISDLLTLLDRLADANAEERKDFADKAVDKPNIRTDLIGALLIFLEQLTGSAPNERSQFAAQVVDQQNIRGDIIPKLLTLLDGLTDADSAKRKEFADKSIANTNIRTDLTSALLTFLNELTGSEPEERMKFIRDFLTPMNQERLNPATPRIDEFVKVLNDEFHDLAVLLKSKLAL